jgi:O-antigen ligase
MPRLNKVTFFLICSLPIVTALAYGTVHQPLIALFYAIVALIVCLWAVDCFAGGALRFSRSKLQLPLLLLGVYGLIQIIPFSTYTDSSGVTGIPATISVDPYATQITAFHIFALCAFLSIGLVYLESFNRLKRVVTVLTIFGFVYGFYAILQSVLSPTKIYGIYGPANAIPFGSFVNRHNFAALMEMLICLPLGALFAGAVGRDKKLLYGVAVALMGSALLLSGSRGGLVALIAEIIVLIILTTRAKGRRQVALKVALSGLLVAAAIGGAIFVGGDTSLTRFAETAGSQDVTSNRTQIWGQTLKVISNYVPFGAGLGAYAQAYTRFDPSSGLERVEQAHNDYLQVLADAGVVGLILGGIFLFLFFTNGARSVRTKNTFRRGVAIGAFAGCCAILVHSLFDFVLHITAISVMFLTLIAMLVASGREYGDDVDEFEESNRKARRSASVTTIGERRRRSESKDSGY